VAVTADLATFKRWVGAVGAADDDNLRMALDQAASSVAFVVYPQYLTEDEVQGAIVDQANRWYQRRRSPEGVAGFSEFGVVRVTALDPDIRRKLRPYIDMTKAGVA
jgi:ABC-type ATPase with predicted acetyltransferase domain